MRQLLVIPPSLMLLFASNMWISATWFEIQLPVFSITRVYWVWWEDFYLKKLADCDSSAYRCWKRDIPATRWCEPHTRAGSSACYQVIMICRQSHHTWHLSYLWIESIITIGDNHLELGMKVLFTNGQITNSIDCFYTYDGTKANLSHCIKFSNWRQRLH